MAQVTINWASDYFGNCINTLPVRYDISRIPLALEVNGVPTNQGISALISEKGHKEDQDA